MTRGLRTALLLTLTILFCWPAAAFAGAVPRRPVPVGTHYYYDQLGAASKALYDAVLASELALGPSKNTVSADLSGIPDADKSVTGVFSNGAQKPAESAAPGPDPVRETVIEPAIAALTCDHPELSWIVSNSWACDWSVGNVAETSASQTVPLRRLSLRLTGQGYAQATTDCDAAGGQDKFRYADTKDLAAYSAALGRAKSDLGPLTGMADAKKAKAIHDWVCSHMRYADTSSERFTGNWRGYQTVYSALAEGVTVCAGYAKAFRVLCDEYDLPCVLVRGNAGGTSHMWNYVRIDGSWYGVDCTTDDLIFTSGRIAYDKFLKGKSGFSEYEETVIWDDVAVSFRYPVLSSSNCPPSAWTIQTLRGDAVTLSWSNPEDRSAASSLFATMEECASQIATDFGEVAAEPLEVSISSRDQMEAQGWDFRGAPFSVVLGSGQMYISSPSDPQSDVSFEEIRPEAIRELAKHCLEERGLGRPEHKSLLCGVCRTFDDTAPDINAVRLDIEKGTLPALSEIEHACGTRAHMANYCELYALFLTKTFGTKNVMLMLSGSPRSSVLGTADSSLERMWKEFLTNEYGSSAPAASPDGYKVIETSSGIVLSGVEAGTHLAQVASVFDLEPGSAIFFCGEHGTERHPEDAAVTGDEITLMDPDGNMTKMSIAVSGDVLGTGRISLSQLVAVAEAYSGKRTLEGAYLAAADWSGSGKLSLSDLVKESEVVRANSAPQI